MPDSDERNRRTILERADRLLKQSRTLRKMSEELRHESRDIRLSADPPKGKRSQSTKKR